MNKTQQPQPLILNAQTIDTNNNFAQQVYAYPVDNNNIYQHVNQHQQFSNNIPVPTAPPAQFVLSSSTTETTRLEQLDAFIQEHEISVEWAIKLRQLEGFDVVVIADDSGSMKTPVKNPNTKDFKNLPTRWQEMRDTLTVIMQLSMILDDDGIDVYFLNRLPVYNVSSQEVLNAAFAEPPSGYTPIVPVLRRVLKEKSKCSSEKKLLIILATDGEPTDSSGKIEDSNGTTEISKLFNVLKNERTPASRIHTTILACTDDDSTMDYLENWDKILNNFDIVDDYYSEKNRIQETQGTNFRFSRGDYIVKIMLGSIDKSLDALDGSSVINQKNQNMQNQHSQQKNSFWKSCIIM